MVESRGKRQPNVGMAMVGRNPSMSTVVFTLRSLPQWLVVSSVTERCLMESSERDEMKREKKE